MSMGLIMKIKPLGLVRLSSSPISGPYIFGIQRSLGVPLPSTILGIIGFLENIRLDKKDVRRDPLLGIGVLTDILLKESTTVLVKGPMLEIMKPYTREKVLAMHLQIKNDVSLIKIDENILRTIRKYHVILKTSQVGKIVPKVEIGIALRDSIEKSFNRTVALGYAFRRVFVQYVDMNEKPLKIELIYELCRRLNIMKSLIRFGGEGRQAQLMVEEMSEEYLKIFEKIVSPIEAKPGYYMVLNYWPLIPKTNTVFLRKEHFIGLEFFERPESDIIGVPRIVESLKEYIQPRINIVRLGLGFSEVLKIRRPQILTLSPGTIIHIKHAFNEIKERLPNIYIKLLKAGYSSLLSID